MQQPTNILPVQPQRTRTNRRARPSLAAFADSGYAPPPPAAISKTSTLSRSYVRNGTVKHDPSLGDDPYDVGVASQLLADESCPPPRDPKVSFREHQNHTTRTMRSFPFTIDGENDTGTARGPGGKFSTTFNYKKSSSGSSNYPKASTISRSATISSAWSGVSNRLFIESLKDAGDNRPANRFTEQFDKLAKKHGIQPFPIDFKPEPGSVSISSASQIQTSSSSSGDSTPHMAANKFWNKLLRRTPSTIDVSKRHGNIKMALSHKRHGSISDLAAIGKGKRDSLKGMHLEDMIRLGGVAIFNLPLGLAPGDLLIPTCIHAAATHILTHGLRAPGIFRVSGNLNTTFALYDFYQRQLEENNNEEVVATTALARLPTQIQYTIHDVAHLLKKLIVGLPGGLLGSPAVFQALYNIHCFVYPDPSLGERMSKKVKARMIALALSSINLHFRIALVCAIFGLLRTINLTSEQEAPEKVKDPHETFVQMKDDALGTVFGPLLLGDKSAHILTDELEDRGGLLVLAKVDPAANTLKRAKSKFDPGHTKRELEKTRRAAVVAQMLIDRWEDISYQMKRINTLSITAEAYDLPAPPQQHNTFKYVEEKEDMLSREPERPQKRAASYQPATMRSGMEKEAPNSHRYSFHGHTLHRPHMHGHHLFDKAEDLMKFSTHNFREDENMFSTSLVPDRNNQLEMSPIVEMTPVREMPTPKTPEPEDSPNWRVMGPGSEMATPRHDDSFSTPNWRTPIRHLETPMQQEPESSPNWRLVGSTAEEEISDTPIRRFDQVSSYAQPQPSYATHENQEADRMSLASSHHDGTQSSGISSGARTPPPDVLPQAAKRVTVIFDPESSPTSFDDVVIGESLTLSAPLELDTTPETIRYGRRAISPVPEMSFGRRETSAEEIERPVTPKPLSYRKKLQTDFSIFEDEPGKMSRQQLTRPAQPALTLRKPNSQSDIQLTPKGKRASPVRPLPESPTRQSIPLQPATPNRRPRESMDSDFEDRYFNSGDSPSPKRNRGGNTALYAEIRRLQRLVDLKTEEASSTKKELELAKNMASAGTLSHIVRETQDELRVWKNRAEWAEKQLRQIEIAQGGSGDLMRKGHNHRYSMS